MKYKLSRIMDIIGGGTLKTSIAEYWGGEIPWLSVKYFNVSFLAKAINKGRYILMLERKFIFKGI